jgi:hypothetical protein
MGGVCCFHIAKSIGGRLGVEYNDWFYHRM